jgi:alpha-beta hydrolase superfamily lysophospholipase
MTTSTPLPRLDRSPATGAVRGTVVVLGGRGESPEVYERFADRIAVDGYRISAFGDARANEASTIAEARAILASNEAGPRLLVASDSGVAVAWRALADGALEADGVVSAGALTSEGTAAIEGTLEIEQRTACPVHRSRLAREGVLTKGALTAADASDEVDVDLARRILVPALVFHGDSDTVSRPDDAFDVYAALPDARVFALEGGRHDVLNDLTHRTVAAEIVQFVERLRTPEQGLVAIPAREAAAVRS